MSSSLPTGVSLETIAVQRLTFDIPKPFTRVLERFRTLAPRIDLAQLRAQTSPEGIEHVIQSTGTTSGFVTFTEFDHGRWIQHFPPFSSERTPADAGDERASAAPTRGVHRVIFGNPLSAIAMVRESLEVALHVPLDCSFIEQDDGSTRMVMLLPDSLVASHAAVRDNKALHNAALVLEGNVYKLIGAIQNGNGV